MNAKQRYHVVIIGGGFGGLYAAQALARAPVQVTLIDRRNFHLFQPLLYQVATGGLSPEDIASPLRAVLKKQKNVRVIAGEVVDIDPVNNSVFLADGEIRYDSLIVATGVSHHYFGRDDAWRDLAPGLKTIEDAVEIRRRVLQAFEAAEREPNPERRRAWQTFVIVGGGPTGVELAGALGELANHTLREEFRNCDTTASEIILVEGLDQILNGFPVELSAAARESLARLGVSVRTGAMVTDITADYVVIQANDTGEQTLIPTQTVLWAAGVKASAMGDVLARRTGVTQDRMGRVMVQPDLTIPGFPHIFVIGDLAHFAYRPDGSPASTPLPGVAQVAMQQGSYVADLLRRRRLGKASPIFQYRDKGMLAVIGRNAAVADVGRLHFAGIPAWLIWIFVHIHFLIEFDNKLKVLIQWGWNYFTRRHGARLITGKDYQLEMQPPVHEPDYLPAALQEIEA